MKKRITLLWIVLATVAMIFAFAACNQKQQEQPLEPPKDVVETENLVFTYLKASKTYSVKTKEDAAAFESVTVPSKINGYQVSTIEDYAFIKNTTLKEVTIEEGITAIGMSAFSGCTSLTTVTLPQSLRALKRGAFNDCSSLNRITLPDEVMSIAENCFAGCSSLVMANIPSALKAIPSGMFTSTAIESVTMPEGILKIGASAFSGCKNLAEVKLNKELQQIDSYAFSGCTALKEILFPRNESLALGDYAFSESGLEKVYIPSNVTLGTYTFMKLAWDSSVANPGDSASPGASGCTAIYYESATGSRGINTFGYTWNRPDLGFRIYVPTGSMDYYRSENPNDEAWSRCVVNSVNSQNGMYPVLVEYDIATVFPDGFPVAE